MNNQLSTEEKEHLMDIFKSKNIVESYFLPDIDHEVKHDIDAKLATFYVAVSSFLNSPLNETIKGESGVGKTYTVKEVLSYFPQDKIHYIGKSSKTSFYHDNGILMDKEGKLINLKDEPKRPLKRDFKPEEDFDYALKQYEQTQIDWDLKLKDSYTEVDLSNRIMFFLDAEAEGFEAMLPVLSHDVESAEFNITESPTAGMHKVKHVRTKGFPVAIFAMTERWMGKREGERATRQAFIVSPENSPEKVGDANAMQAGVLEWEKKYVRPEKKKLQELLLSIRNAFVNNHYQVQIPFLNINELYPAGEIRDMRGFNQFKDTIKASTALHIHQRVIIEVEGTKYVLSSAYDVEAIMNLFSRVYETTRANADRKTIDLYWKYCVTFNDDIVFPDGFTVADMIVKYNTVEKKKVASSSMVKRLNSLSSKGYLDKHYGNLNNRDNRYTCLITKREDMLTYSANSEKAESLGVILEKGLKSFLKKVDINIHFYIIENIFGTDQFKLKEISREEAEKIILCINLT
jgi:hypothetical protein